MFLIADIEEHAQVGTHLLRVSAHDIDSDAKDAIVLYYMDDFSALFSIKPTTGNTCFNSMSLHLFNAI